MSQSHKNKIEATDTSISRLLKEQKFTIDYFQREYRWQEKHMKLLVEDLTSTFLKSYHPEHQPKEVANYQSYYLGPVVFSVNAEGKKSIIDGQQRITSITLFLIYLNNLQKNFDENEKVAISEMVFSVKHREKSFNMTDEIREPCLKSLFETGSYTLKSDDEETVKNMVERYEDIEEIFPEVLNSRSALPYFIDWFKENVVIVEITAYSEDNAYLIFETMNDRGLNLTNTEMLKGYILSKITDKNQRNEINEIWKDEIQKLHKYDENLDQGFFQAWFRSKYAISIRPGKADSKDQDFELIGSRFHSWFKDNHRSSFLLKTSDDFYTFFKCQFPFYVKWYLKIIDLNKNYNPNIPSANYITHWGIALSLQAPLLLAPIILDDDDETLYKKINFVSHYIETFTVRRSINFRKFDQSSIKYTMFNIIKLIRSNDLIKLGVNLTSETEKITEDWAGISEFGLHGQNGKFVKHLLSRISSYLDSLIGKDTNYTTYHHPNGKPFETEHIWANKFEEHKDEFEQENDFQKWRNMIGALVLLPQGTNQSFSSDKYKDKLEHYIKENTYVQTLHENYYKKNPNFLKSAIVSSLVFKGHPEFKINDIKERQELVKRICEKIWSVEFYK